jgi:hypothetical protein
LWVSISFSGYRKALRRRRDRRLFRLDQHRREGRPEPVEPAPGAQAFGQVSSWHPGLVDHAPAQDRGALARTTDLERLALRGDDENAVGDLHSARLPTLPRISDCPD